MNGYFHENNDKDDQFVEKWKENFKNFPLFPLFLRKGKVRNRNFIHFIYLLLLLP